MIVRVLKSVAPIRLRRVLRRFWSSFQHPDLPLLYPYLVGAVKWLVPPEQPAVLLVSLPRGGSSWVGSVLGSSAGALYLREPLTYTYMHRFPSEVSFFEYEMCKDKKLYTRCAADAFSGIPRFDPAVVPFPSQWGYRGRRARRVVVKEVNPLALGWIIENYNPRIAYLVRHPVAVANSFFAQAWTGEQIRRRFSEASLLELQSKYDLTPGASFWEQSGALQAIAQNIAIAALRSASAYQVVKYEDLCMSPGDRFRDLLTFCGLEMDAGVTRQIVESSQSATSYAPGQGGTERNSAAMADRWRRSVAPEHIELVKVGYFRNHPLYYDQEKDW